MAGSEDVSFLDREALAKAVQKELDQVLASEFFTSSPRHQLLLRTIVNESLARRTEALKEIVLARDVFGRTDYDPKRHTLVRVEVNAVRRKLAEYYRKSNSEGHVHIDIPVGRYVAVFSSPPAKPQEHRRRTRWYVFAGCVAALLVVAVVLFGTRRPSAPAGVPVQITFDTGWTAQPAVSRDGSGLVYSSDRGPHGNADIWIQQAGKAPRQLTYDPAHDITPDISPDGKRVVFRSWRKEEGVWSISAEGGNAKLLAKGGYAPRFSPDGKWIAFSGMATDEAGHIFTVPADGGVPEQLDYGTEGSDCPVWSPDGSKVVFVARDTTGARYDLWIAKAKAPRNEPARPLGIETQLHALNLPALYDCAQDWIDDRLLFVTNQHDTGFLFQVPSGPSDRLGQIRAVPSAIGARGARFLRGPGGQMSILFATERRQTNIWGYELSGAGRREQLTHDDTLKPGNNGTWPALSGDGNVLAFITERTGSPDICLKDLRTGAEQLLAAAPSSRSPLFLDHNGSRVVFLREHGAAIAVLLRNVAEKTDRLLTTECPVLHDWSSNGEFLLCSRGNNLFQLRLGQSVEKPLLYLTHEPVQARFSPDARWIALSTTGKGQIVEGFLAPLDGSNRTIPICQEVYVLSLHWAPDGNAVYYWSMRDGFRCLYMQPLQSDSKVPQGDPIAVLHRHGVQSYPWSGGTLAVGSGRMVMTLMEELANIWKVDLPR
ncbi:MAG: PD40 domain-containing protein [Acidobacteriaceae bacterium]|nr:PD40 domain-containing protein [Acidobacteriaceae bacterium]